MYKHSPFGQKLPGKLGFCLNENSFLASSLLDKLKSIRLVETMPEIHKHWQFVVIILMNVRTQMEHTLHNAILMTETGMDLKDKCQQGEKYVNYLRSVALRASRNIRSMHTTGLAFLNLAQKVVANAISTIDTTPDADQSIYNIKLECERLLGIIEKELADVDESETVDVELNSANISEKIRYLENKQRLVDSAPNLQQTCSVKSVKSDVDEKYPENVSRDSLIDLNTIVNLPPVPEDIFTCFANKPTRTSSLSSLKGMRKVKLFLQRAANNSEDEDSSDLDDHDVVGEEGEKINIKKHLGNIKEETQQD